MNPAMISKRVTSARILLTGAAAVLALATVLAGGTGAAASARGARAATAPGTITTVAGGAGGPAKATEVAMAPCQVDAHGGGIYVADKAVRNISASGQLTTLAGTGVNDGPLPKGGLATGADFSTCGAVADHASNLVLADLVHFQIDVVPAKSGTFYGQAMTAGHIYAVAGNGKFGYSASGVPAKSTRLANPDDVTVDGHGNLVIDDSGNGQRPNGWARVQVVAASTGTFYGQAMTAGDLYTVAGGGSRTGGMASGFPATQAAIGRFVGQVSADHAGNLLVAAAGADRVWLVAAVSGTFYGKAMTAGDIYSIAGTGGGGSPGDGGLATKTSVAPEGVAVDAAGNAVIADTGFARVRVIAARTGTFYGQAMTTGHIYSIAGNGTQGFSGDGGPATAAELQIPTGVSVDDGTGNVVIADLGNGAVRVVAATTGTFYGQAMTAGHIYTVGGVAAQGNTELFSGDGGPAARAELSSPKGVTLDSAGNQFIADDGNHRIRMVAASTGTFFGQAMTAGHIYTVAGNGTGGFAGDGSPATSAELDFPQGVAADHAGNLVIADTGNQRVRVVAAKNGTFYGQAMTAGHIYTVAGDGSSRFSGDGGPATSAGADPAGVAVDPAGNLVIADSDNNRVRVVAASTGTFYRQAMTAGNIYTVAGNGTAGFAGDGGPGTSAELNAPQNVAADHAGNVIIADAGNERIRVVAAGTGTFYGQAMTTGHIYTIAGNGTLGFTGDGGPATSAELALPDAVAVDSTGNVLIADSDNNRIRVIAAASGTFYGEPMSTGNIYTVAGNGTGGFTGDGGPATGAELDFPAGLAADGHNLVISDNRRIRLITG